MEKKLWILAFSAFLTKGILSDKSSCPFLLDTPLPSHLPYGVEHNLSGIRLIPTNHTDFTECMTDCCEEAACNAALTVSKDDKEQCMFVYCEKDELCLPAKEFGQYPSTLVLIHPNTPPWPNVTVAKDTVCEVGLELESCKPGEICAPLHSKSRNGVCRCGEGSKYSDDGCIPNPTLEVTTALPVVETITIAVSVSNKTIRLPESSSSLTAFTVPAPTKDNPFSYEWKAQESNLQGTESDSNSETLKLSALEEGVYVFKVSVTSKSPPGYGETMANVTVLPLQRINTPPKAVIVPARQIVTLPTNKAVIDGSKSSDDSEDLSFTWVVSSGPMGYQPELPAVPTLTLDHLIAGNYSIKLTVKDKEGESDSAVSSLSVLKETDYPPTANAGEDKIVYLPLNTVILNGNKSSDDHEIVSWEWTKKKPEDGMELPADITGARTPYLKIANLEQGIYNFVLKVTDSADQMRSDEVSVYVKPPSNLPPHADAGQDQDLSLPLPFIVLDGSGSTDDLNITQYFWKQLEGPNLAKISLPGAAQTNVSSLAVGTYKFQLTVSDGSGNNDTDDVLVTIRQDTNQAPSAKILQPDKLVLPVSSITLDGSESSDDLAIESWEWSREPESIAAGLVVGGWNSSKLVLTDLIQGNYLFSLKVADAQGKTNIGKISFTVEEDKDILSSVEIVFDQELGSLTQSELRNVLDAIKIFVRGKGDVVLESLKPARRTGFATVVFKVKSTAEDSKYLKGLAVVSSLKATLRTNPDVLGIPVLNLETVVCQNTCGGHGHCNQNTRECVCSPFWVENSFKRYILKGEPNCDWSVIYVIVICMSLFVIVLVVYCLYCGCWKDKRKYNRLDTGDIELTGPPVGGLVTSETDSEDEVIFESAKKGRRLNGSIRGVSREQSNGSLNKLIA